MAWAMSRGFHFGLFGQQHGSIGGKVAVRLVLWYFDYKSRHLFKIDAACFFGLGNALADFAS